jgi:enoyl reductase-like protein
MANEHIADLEKNWLQAESMADELKQQAERIDDELRKSDNGNLKVLINQSEELQAKHAAADKAASEAFDKLWQAQSGGGSDAMQMTAK